MTTHVPDALTAVHDAQDAIGKSAAALVLAEGELVAEMASTLPAVQPRSAQSVWKVAGVCTHMESAPYSTNVDRVISAVTDLHLTQIRSRIYKGNVAQRDAMVRLAKATGARFTCNLGQPGQAATPAQMVAWLETFGPDVVAIVEGNNEPNLQLGADWVALTRKWMADLAAALKASTQAWVRALPLLAPALGQRRGYEELGPLPMCGLGNLHVYQGGGQADFRLEESLQDEQAVTGSKAVIVTETGYHNAMANTGTHISTSEKAAGVYVPKVILENALRDVLGAYLYELTDNPANPAGTDQEAHFGLLRADWTTKPAYSQLRSLGEAIADTTAAPSLAKVQLGVTGPADLASMLLARSDGSHQVVLWRRVEVWDRVAQKDLVVAPAPVRVRFAKPVKLATRVLKPGETIDGQLAEGVLVYTVRIG